ncbi:hypothetical protein N9B78_01500 [Flavobacteriaceae bacterium]|nr:hypothetical protein [Flavobacteriaceae bacterium]
MSKGLLKLLFLVSITSHIYTQQDYENILFVGHAYGSHSAKDQSLDPIFLEHTYNNSQNYNEIILGGDFLYNCQNLIEFENFLKFYKTFSPRLVIGGHDVCDKVYNLLNYSFNNVRQINETLLFYLNTSIESNNEVDYLYDLILKNIEIKKPKNIIIFTHQLIFSKSDWNIRVNSRGDYNFANTLYDKIYSKFYKSEIKFHFVSGDIGAFPYTPYAYYNNSENFNYYASGIGNGSNYKAIVIKIKDELSFNFLDLENNMLERKEKYSKLYVQLYQFPKLLLSHLKRLIFPFD